MAYLYTDLMVAFLITRLHCHIIFTSRCTSILSSYKYLHRVSSFLYAFPVSSMRAVRIFEALLRFYTAEAFHPLRGLSNVILSIHVFRTFMKRIRSPTNTFCTDISVLSVMKFIRLSPCHISRSDTVYPDRVYPDTVYPETVYHETVYPETVYPETVYPDTVYPDTVYPESVP
jgi:hypothetical protein